MVDRDEFVAWARSRFPVVRGEGDKDIKVDSPFSPGDDDCKLYCCPAKNAFHCWKSGESGNLFELVAFVDSCTYEEARETLKGRGSVRQLEKKLKEQFQDRPIGKPKPKMAFPPDTFRLTAMQPHNPWRRRAEMHLAERLMPIEDFYVCISGKYRDRVIIPYYGRGGELIYWNGRTFANAKAKYQGPDKDEWGIGKGDVIYMPSWPDPGTRLYLTEGEFDARSLSMCGFPGAAVGGKELSPAQIELLRPYKVALCLDADESGGDALHILQARLARQGIEDVTFVRPPKVYKDWNKMLVDAGDKVIRAYVRREEKPLNEWVSAAIRFYRN